MEASRCPARRDDSPRGRGAWRAGERAGERAERAGASGGLPTPRKPGASHARFARKQTHRHILPASRSQPAGAAQRLAATVTTAMPPPLAAHRSGR